MTHFASCIGCATLRDTCPTLAALKAAIAGKHVTTIKHKCPTRKPLMTPGDPVMVETFTCSPEVQGLEGPTYDRWKAIFIEQRGSRAHVYIRPGELSEKNDFPFVPMNNHDGHANILLSRVKPILGAEPVDMTKCATCEQRPGVIGRCGASVNYIIQACKYAPRTSFL